MQNHMIRRKFCLIFLEAHFVNTSSNSTMVSGHAVAHIGTSIYQEPAVTCPSGPAALGLAAALGHRLLAAPLPLSSLGRPAYWGHACLAPGRPPAHPHPPQGTSPAGAGFPSQIKRFNLEIIKNSVFGKYKLGADEVFGRTDAPSGRYATT